MDEKDVAQYLKANPQFFDRHADLLETIFVPHPHGARAVSLAERQVIGLRDKARQLQEKLGELIQFGEENDAVSEKVHRLALALAAARDFTALTQALHFHLREDLAVPHVALRLWGRPLPAQAVEARPVSEEQRRQAQAMGGPHCGAAAGSPFVDWFGEAQAQLRSIALVPLGTSPVAGLLALGSEDPRRFFPEMGTLYLRRIGELYAAALAARL